MTYWDAELTGKSLAVCLADPEAARIVEIEQRTNAFLATLRTPQRRKPRKPRAEQRDEIQIAVPHFDFCNGCDGSLCWVTGKILARLKLCAQHVGKAASDVPPRLKPLVFEAVERLVASGMVKSRGQVLELR